MTEPATIALRTGVELIRATAPFDAERPWTSWRLLIVTLFILAGLLALALFSPMWPVQILAGVLAGLVQVRLFIFYHDALHGAIFRRSRVAYGLMTLVGIYMMSVRSVWRESHDFHHQHNAKLASSGIGSFPIMSLAMAQRATPGQMRRYRLLRHPATIFGGYLSVFLLGMAIGPFVRDPRRHWSGPLAVLVHVALVGVIAWQFGWVGALAAVVVPSAVATAMGSYLFYAQHNFPSMQVENREGWNFTTAALRSSSMFEMGWLMRWLTGNIGFHHVHHLNHRIPFYRLPEAMAAIPELQVPGRTSWRIMDVIACLRLYMYDHEQGRMLTRAEAIRVRA